MMSPDVRFAFPLRPPADRRVADRRRAAIARMMDALVREMLAALRDRRADVPGDAGEAVVDRVVRHLAQVDRALTDLLGLRADTHEAARRLRLHAGFAVAHGGANAVLDRLAESDDSEIAAAAGAYRLAESGRLDPFGEARIALDELDGATAAPLGWTIAAALRAGAGADGDDLLGIVADLLGALPGRDGAADAAGRLARASARGDRDPDRLTIDALDDGWLVLGAALLGECVGLDGSITLWILLVGEPRLVAALARIATPADRARAALLLLPIARARHADEDNAEAAVAAWLDDYERLDAAVAARIVATLRAPIAYRQAEAAFGRDGR